jgi:MFS family permease
MARDNPSPVSSIPRIRLAVLFMVMLVAAAGNTAMQSVLPAIGATLDLPDVFVSLAFSWSALLWVLTAPRWARQSDQRGRKALMRVGILGFVASMMLCALALWAGLNGWIGGTLAFLLFAVFRSLYGGFGSAAPPAVQAYVAARTPPEERTKALSLVASAFGLGTVIGPTLAPFLVLPIVGLAGPMFVFSAIGVLTLTGLKLYLPDDTPSFDVKGRVASYTGTDAHAVPGPDMLDDKGDQIFPGSDSAPRLAWTDRAVLPWHIAGLIGGHAQAMIAGIVGFLILDRLLLRTTPELAALPTGHVMWVGAMATLLAQWGLIPLLSPNPRSAVSWGSGIAGVGTLVLAWGADLATIGTGFAIAALGFGLYRPGFTAGASLAVPRGQQGQVAGQVASINGAAYIVAPAIGVGIYNWHPELSFGLIATLCFGLAIWGWKSLHSPVSERS